MTSRLTITNDRQISTLRPGTSPLELKVSEARGLTLRVLPSGLKSFEFRYIALTGQRRRMVLVPTLRWVLARPAIRLWH